MSHDSCSCSKTPAGRPVVSGLAHGPAGRSFTLVLEPGQELPPHRNAARVVITAVHGSGAITVAGAGTRALVQGAVVRLDPDVGHAVVAGGDGLELLVALSPNCCESC